MTSRTRRALRVAVPAVAAVALLAARAGAQAPAAPTLLAGCYVPSSGTVYRIDVPEAPAPGAPKRCLSPAHVQFAWNATGPAGAQGERGPAGERGPGGAAGVPGAPGVSGWQRVEASYPGLSLTAGGELFRDASCPAGKKLLGGGATLFSVSGSRVIVHVSRPAADDVWRAGAANIGVGASTFTLLVSAICANVQ